MKITDPLFSGNTVISGSFKVSGSFNVNDNDLSAGAVGFPFSGSAAVTGSLNVTGSILLNGEQVTISLVPTITTVYPLTVKESDESYTIEITGSRFDGNAEGYLVGTDGNQALPTTSTRVSETNIRLFYSSSARLTGGLEPYDTVVVNGNGENATIINNISVNDSPLWVTQAGRLGTIYAGTSLTASFFISASDEEGAYPISYSLEVGTLPQGLTFLTGSGEITGSSPIGSDTGNYNASGIQSNLTFKATDNDGVFATRNFNILKKWIDGTSENLAVSSAQTLLDLGITTDGYYFIKPDGVNIHYVYCDLTTEGGGWMLMQRLKNDSQFISNSDFNLQTVDGYAGVPKIDHSNSSGFGTTKFNRFTTATGTKYLRIIPTNYSISGYDGMYFNFGTDTTKVWPGGSSLEASNRSTLVGSSTTSWVATIYPTLANAIAGTAGETGTYSSGNHYYPTTYPNEQLFYRGSGTGIRWADQWNNSLSTDTGEGTVWVKIS